MAEGISVCPDCGVRLPVVDGPQHRYIGASAACWALFSALNNGGEPSLAPAPWRPLLTDAYAAQHPGSPSPQAIQSVAVHLLTLYGILERGRKMEEVYRLRQRGLPEARAARRARFHWLTPPDLTQTRPLTTITTPATPAARSAQLQPYVEAIWEIWAAAHRDVIATWYEQYILTGTPS
jgi:hypothetical protein